MGASAASTHAFFLFFFLCTTRCKTTNSATQLLYLGPVEIGSMSARKGERPLRSVNTTALAGHICQKFLEKLHVRSIHHRLRQIVIYINHCENRSKEQRTLELSLQSVTVQLLAMAETVQLLAIPCFARELFQWQ